ncbi:MAG TPA: SRPBCC domain-containing protein [Candidatus Kapabacteria bacterium]|nr:SRPBCC domain-containing protein [Candidatus Kapabacteria bacterium]
MKRELVFERTYPHPPSLVWRALTEKEALGEWLMENDFEPRVGHRFTFRTKPAPGFDGIVQCEVLEIVEQKRLVYSWKGGPIDTVITFTLEEAERGTKLHVRQTGFDGLRSVLVSYILQSGIRPLYDRKLPVVLEKLSRGNFVAAPADCSTELDSRATPRVKALMHVAAILPEKKRGEQAPPRKEQGEEEV